MTYARLLLGGSPTRMRILVGRALLLGLIRSSLRQLGLKISKSRLLLLFFLLCSFFLTFRRFFCRLLCCFLRRLFGFLLQRKGERMIKENKTSRQICRYKQTYFLLSSRFFLFFRQGLADFFLSVLRCLRFTLDCVLVFVIVRRICGRTNSEGEEQDKFDEVSFNAYLRQCQEPQGDNPASFCREQDPIGSVVGPVPFEGQLKL